jgi:hypothetical protein
VKTPLFDFESTSFSRHPKAQFREVGDEIFLVHPDGEQIHNLNPTAAALWRLLDTPMSGHEISQVFQAAFPIMAMRKIEDDINRVLSELLTTGFVQVKEKSHKKPKSP